MKWLIPAKTFLLGEYAAVAEASAIILTTTPCFELSLISQAGISGIHPESPAGLWWQEQKIPEIGLSWYDPYAGRGGLGASSAQFLASYWASCYVKNIKPDNESMLQVYYQKSWAGKGLRPSGYDVIAQSQKGCVYINKQKKIIESYAWPFDDLSFFLIHTGVKLATHHHLQQTTLPEPIDYLSELVDAARQAFEHISSDQLINSINLYQEELTKLNLVTEHSLSLLNQINKFPEILASKGCGALGADILLLLSSRKNAEPLKAKLKKLNLLLLATENSLSK